jgi:DNA-binding MarR family transcriptional regulator
MIQRAGVPRGDGREPSCGIVECTKRWKLSAIDLRHRGRLTDDEAAQVVPVERVEAFTAKQGQYLAFIYYYTKIHRVAPAESDFQRFFRVTPPVVHQMIKTLDKHGFIEREPGRPRSIRLRLTRAELPDLQ